MSGTGTETDPTKTETDPKDDPNSVEFWKAKSRDWERKAKDNKTAAERLAELEAANASDIEKANAKTAAAEKVAADKTVETLRLRIALRHSISDEDADLFLTGADEETMTRQAERLAGKAADGKAKEKETKTGKPVVPGEGKQTDPPKGDEVATFTKQLFAQGTEA